MVRLPRYQSSCEVVCVVPFGTLDRYVFVTLNIDEANGHCVTGIAFVLLVVRVHSASEEANISLASPSFIHFHAGDSDLESEETCESMPGA